MSSICDHQWRCNHSSHLTILRISFKYLLYHCISYILSYISQYRISLSLFIFTSFLYLLCLIPSRHIQPQSAEDMIAEEPPCVVHGRVAKCNGGGGIMC